MNEAEIIKRGSVQITLRDWHFLHSNGFDATDCIRAAVADLFVRHQFDPITGGGNFIVESSRFDPKPKSETEANGPPFVWDDTPGGVRLSLFFENKS